MDKIQTPFFCIRKPILDEGLRKLQDALQHAWPNYAIGYSYKTNTFPWVISYMRDHGCYAEVVSDDEYELAKKIGANKVIYNGIAKSKDTFLEAVRKGCIVNIDSEYEIDWLDELAGNGYEVGIRVNFDLEAKCPGQTQCGEEGERFGFCYENGELKKAIDRITDKGIRVSGLHLHKSSKTRMPDIYRAIAETAVEIAQAYELSLSYLDVGGGFFGGLSTKPQFFEYFDMMADILSLFFTPEKTTLIVEPGMALIGAAVDYITSVKDVKVTTRNIFVVTDGSRTQIDPLMTKHSYFCDIELHEPQERDTVDKQIVSGFTCMEHDRLFTLENYARLTPKDRIIYHKVGAYTMCLTPLFIKWFPEVYVDDGTDCKLARTRWGADEYLMKVMEKDV